MEFFAVLIALALGALAYFRVVRLEKHLKDTGVIDPSFESRSELEIWDN